jgi:hypothetical protein
MDILFEGVEFLKLRRSYAGLTLTLAGEDFAQEFAEVGLPPIRLLRLVISSPSGTGLVACSRLTVTEAPAAQDEREAAVGDIVFSAIA